jgi:methionine-rich copper-binding protein CopC
MPMRQWTWLGILLIGLASLPADAHTFPDHAEPRVGHRVAASPAQVRIWFDHAVLRGTLRVETAEGQLVTLGAVSASTADPHLVDIAIPQLLPPGDYHVYYEVEDTDGHTTEGDYMFSVGPGGN